MTEDAKKDVEMIEDLDGNLIPNLPLYSMDILKSYEQYPDWYEETKRAMEYLYRFFEANGLITCKVTDDQNHVIRDHIMASEFTEEGLKMIMGPKNPVDRWLASKGSNKNPPDMKILEKYLKQIRDGEV